MYVDEDYENVGTMYPHDEGERPWFGLISVMEDCLIPTFSSICAHMLHLLTSCVLFRVSTQLSELSFITGREDKKSLEQHLRNNTSGW